MKEDKLSEPETQVPSNVHPASLEYLVMDAEDLTFEDESFDSVVNIESSHCYSSRKVFFDNVHRVLRPPCFEERKSNDTFVNQHQCGLFFYADFFSAGEID